MPQGSRRHHRKQGHRQGVLGLTNIALLTISIVLLAVMTFVIYSYQLLNFNYLNYLLVGVLLGILFLSFLAIITKKVKGLTTFILCLFIIGSLTSLYFVRTVIDFSNKITATAGFSEIEMSVVVPADSPINDIKEVNQLAAPLSLDKENIDALVADVLEKKEKQLTTVEEDSYASAYDKVMSGQVEAMVLNGAYASLLETAHPDFKNGIKSIYTYRLKKEVQSSKRPQTNANVMNVYISGIDTYGSISTVSRSDVNILMTINRDTNKILLTTTPRDSYVAIAGGGNNQKDKLTHAGIYGVEASIETLENLYDVPIDYYAKINFTSFINLIDVLGGVDVTNDQAFSANGYDFPVGKVTMDSKKALVFVRERYSLEHGDNDRGKNQMKVIAAIIEKITSLQAIGNYQQIVTELGDSIQTSMPLVTMMSLANDQLASGRHYTVTSQVLEGTGSTGQYPSYAMPSASLYMLSIDDGSLAQVKDAIKATMEGQ